MQDSQSTNELGLQATLKFLEGLPTGTEMQSAIDNIDSWEQTIRKTGQEELLYIADELKKLRNLLSAKELDGKAIGQSLITIGGHTHTAAGNADKQISDELQSLGNWLQKVGTDLS
jgi:hypothetical protein